MADYTRPTQRFVFAGLSDLPSDLLPPGKLPYARNVRAYVDGSLRPRAGLTVRSDASLGSGIHSLMRLNDPTTFNGGVPAVRVLGAGTEVFRGAGTSFASIDSGYSGNPLVFLSAQPPQSPRPWLYIADTNQYRKVTTDGNPVAVGIAQPSAPSTEPSVVLLGQQVSEQDIQAGGVWLPAGTVASVVRRDDLAEGGIRVDTVISQILYDVGATGYASIVPADTANITVGTLLIVGPAFEAALVTDVTIAVADTTVAAIIYDSGVTGLCTIQPTGSLGVGQLDAPPIDAYRQRAYPAQPGVEKAIPKRPASGVPPAPEKAAPTRRIRQVDFPVNAILVLNGAEVVRILSVAVGPDGVQSFRCSTATTISAGQTITGLAAFRIFLVSTYGPGTVLQRGQLSNTLTYPDPLPGERSKMTGGIQTELVRNLSQFYGNLQAVLPEDELHVAVRVDRLTEVVSVRVYIDVNDNLATSPPDAASAFLKNYYFHEWRASDIVAAIQATNALNVVPLADARRTVVANQQLEQPSALRRGAAVPGRGGRGEPVATDAIAVQLGLGNSQWVDLRVKVGTLVHVGTDTTRTLADAQAFEILVSCEAPYPDVTPDPIAVDYSDLQIYGGGGLDVGEVGDPYVWTYRYRSSATGAVSNPSPASRGGAIPRRQNVDLVATPSADPQVDKIDWFRLGGALTQFTYVGTGPNSSAAFRDDRMDSAIDGGEALAYDNFQPWAVADLPRTGTCSVAGTAVRQTGGDTFNTAWAPGSIVLINGRATTLYASPADTTLLHVVESVGSGSGLAFSLPQPTLLSQPLGRVWGDYQGFYFACGDAINPGTLYWSHGNNIETTSDGNALLVTSPSEPLMAGGIYNTFPFVFSSDQLYALILQPGAVSAIRAMRTPCGRGLWTPWAWDIGPEGIFFLASDGIFLTSGGSPAQALTTPDLRAIFPKDGLPGVATNGIPAPDMTQTARLRLSYIAGWLYFDYLDLTGAGRTLILDTAANRWFLDDTELTDLQTRLEEPGRGIYNQMVGGADGFLYQYDEAAIRDGGVDLSWDVWTPWVDGGLPRLVKQFGDVGVGLDAAGSITGILAQPVAEDGTVFPTAVTLGLGATGRDTYIIDLTSGGGVLARNFGVRFSGTLGSTDTGRPSLFWWEPSYLPKAENIARRATDWENLGYVGAKFVQGVVIRANTYGQNKTVKVQKDGGVTALTLTLNHDGETQVAYPLAAAGWLPFVTELIRLEGDDTVDWHLLDYRFVWEPAPELATQWETQWTSEDWPGYGSVRDMVFAYEATTPFILTFTYDDHVQVYTIPANGGLYTRFYFEFCPNKELAHKFQWKTDEPGRIYKRDVSTRIQPWGQPGGYRVVNPFGGPSRISGAEI